MSTLRRLAGVAAVALLAVAGVTVAATIHTAPDRVNLAGDIQNTP